MRKIGFSTGAIAFSDFRRSLDVLQRTPINVVELSALREDEIDPLLEALPSLDLGQFSFISFHAPSRYDTTRELDLIEKLAKGVPERWPVILHPDASRDLRGWQCLGSRLAIENMDRRKSTGRTVEELWEIFEVLPEAKLCCDVGHARQVDTTMIEASLILREFGHRLVEAHVSEVDTLGKHSRLSDSTISAFQRVANLIPDEVPLIIESPVEENEIIAEVERVELAFTAAPVETAVG